MGEKITYFDMAENDYLYLKQSYGMGQVANAMAYISQNICERYLKHVIEEYCLETNNTNILRTHSIRNLKNYIRKNVPDFSCNWEKVMQADGYYFSTRYPGNDAIMVSKEDIDECMEAVEETRKSVSRYMTN